MSDTTLAPAASSIPAPIDSSTLANIQEQSNQAQIENKASIIGADLASQENGDSNRSIYDRASDILTKAVPLTGAAVVNSFANTAVELGNFLGGDFHKATIENEFGSDSPLTDYYNANKGFIEGAALFGGSLLPGLGAIKALKLATAAGTFGETFSAATGLMSGIRTAAIDEAIGDAVGNSAGNSLFAGNLVAKAKAIAGGIGDEALNGAIYQAATLATMKASPLLDNNTLEDNVKDILTSATQFGLVGGLFEGLGALSKIKKGVTEANISAKPQEIVDTRGLGNITPGDRIVGLISKKQETPAPVTALQKRTVGFADTVLQRELTSNFSDLTKKTPTSEPDTDLAQTMQKYVADKVNIDGMTGEDLGNQIGGMSRIGRLGNTDVVSHSSDAFYVPDKVDLLGQLKTGKQFDIGDITTPTLGTPEVANAKALVLKNPQVLPIIGHAYEPSDINLIALSGISPSTPLGAITTKYSGVQDAFSKGVDIFVDKLGKTHINLTNASALQQVARPGEARILTAAERKSYNATGALPVGSKPLNSSAIFLNVKDNTIFGEAPLPVVGDVGKSILKGDNTLNILDPKDGSIASSFKIQTPDGNPFDYTQQPFTANAQYVGMGLRGIKDGDVIDPEHLPQLEALYSDMSKFEAQNPKGNYLDEKDVSFAGGAEIPDSAHDLLDHINDVKRTNLLDLMAAGKNTDEIGQILNAPQSYMSKGADFTDPKSIITPLEDNTSINTVRLAYNIGTTRDNAGNVLRGMNGVAYRMQLAVQSNTDATAKMLNTIFLNDPNKAQAYLSNMKVTKTAGDATLAGAGEGAIFAANSSYGTIGQQFERVGRTFQELQAVRHAAVSDALAPALSRIRNNPTAAAEWGNFNFIRHSTGENYVLLDKDVAAKYNLPENTAVLENSVTYKKGVQSDWNSSYSPPGFIPGNNSIAKGLKTHYYLSDDVAAVERAHVGLLAARNDLRDNFYAAQGLPGRGYNPDVLYAPPIDTSKYPYFAFVKSREGYAMGNDDTHVMVAKSADELRQKIGLLDVKYQAFTKDNIKEFKQAQGTYDYNRNFTSLRVKSDLARIGGLTGLVPELRAVNNINSLVKFHMNQETQVLRDYTELHNAEIFSKLDAMGERFQATANSTFGRIGLPLSKQLAADNPYATYTRTALGISAKDQYPTWGAAQDKLEALANTAFNTVAQTFGAVRKGLLSPEDATKVAQRMGLGSPYGDTMNALTKASYYGGLANKLPDKNILSKVVGTGNAILGSLRIRLDAFQQLVHAVTLPIMASMEHYGASKNLQDLLSATTPGAKPLQIPAFSRTLYGAVRNFFGPDSEKLEKLYATVGMPRDQLFMYRSMINELSVPASGASSSQWLQKVKNAGDWAEKISGTRFVNSFNHFVASDIGKQIGEAAGLQGQDLIDHIGTFTNRVLGNLTAGQRGAIFHGPVGQAIGLFQAYQFNLMQQVFRHVEEGNYKALAIGTGMQSSIFGLSSLPGFPHLNTLIQQHDGNTSKDDLYSTAVNSLGKKTADYLLYGALSGITGTALYSRGDLQPRNPAMIPTNPMDLPIVQTGLKAYQNIAQLASNLSNTGNVPASLMLALEHNGLSRPLTGLMELMQGYATDNKGNLISSINNGSTGFSDLFSLANMSRLGGARPLDEAIALDALYRNNQATAADEVRKNELGDALKTQLYNGGTLAPEVAEKFAAQYAAAGGDINNFNKWVLDQTNHANGSVANQVFKQYSSSPSARNRMQEMGGQPLPQYNSTTPEEGQ